MPARVFLCMVSDYVPLSAAFSSSCAHSHDSSLSWPHLVNHSLPVAGKASSAVSSIIEPSSAHTHSSRVRCGADGEGETRAEARSAAEGKGVTAAPRAEKKAAKAAAADATCGPCEGEQHSTLACGRTDGQSWVVAVAVQGGRKFAIS